MVLLSLIPSTTQANTQKPTSPSLDIEAVILSAVRPPVKTYEEAILGPLHAAQAQKAAEETERRRQLEEQQQAIANRPQFPGTYINNYTPGNCTALVASMIQVPSDWGNARNWAYNARAQGWTVSDTPVVGAIAQTTVGYYGHVAIVKQIDGGFVYVIEENYQGLGVISYRWAPSSGFSYIF